MNFNSVKDWAKWAETKAGQKAILSTQDMTNILKKAGEQLRSYLIDELNLYYASYTPTVYDRTGATVDSIQVSFPKKISVNEYAVEIYFDERAYHKSYIGKDQPDGYVPHLLDVGWNIEDKVQPSRPMFTKHPGTHFIGKAIKRFNANNPYGLKIIHYKGGEIVG